MVGSACTISETGYYLYIFHLLRIVVNVKKMKQYIQPGTKAALLASGIPATDT